MNVSDFVTSGMSIIDNRVSLAVQVRTNIRFKHEISYMELVSVFKDISLFDKTLHTEYFLAFFESCYPSLIKKFMFEQNISREQVLAVFDLLPQVNGVVWRFKERLENGEF